MNHNEYARFICSLSPLLISKTTSADDLKAALRDAITWMKALEKEVRNVDETMSEAMVARLDVLRSAKEYKVTPLYTRQKAHFDVTDKTGVSHSIMVQVWSDTTYAGIQGIPNGQIDSYALAAIQWIARHGRIDPVRLEPDRMTQARRNECLQLVRESNRKVNEIRIGDKESATHSKLKMMVCKWLHDDGKQFVCEAIFKDGSGRADILVLDDFEAIEIANTESDESLQAKALAYPPGVRLRIIRATKGGDK